MVLEAGLNLLSGAGCERKEFEVTVAFMFLSRHSGTDILAV